MKALLRKNYTWEDVFFDPESENIKTRDLGKIVAENMIVSIKDDERVNYLRCMQCNELVLNTPEAIAKHISIKESWEQCATCRYCNRHHIKTENEILHPDLKNNSFVVESKDIIEITCECSWNSPNVFTNSARECCKYKHCTTNTLKPYDSVLISHPGAFDNMATIDAVDSDRWIFVSKDGDTYGYKLNARTNLFMYVHSTGIIDKFVYSCRGSYETCYYSKQYDKLFWEGFRKYSTTRPDLVSENIEKTILREVRKIYGGNEND